MKPFYFLIAGAVFFVALTVHLSTFVSTGPLHRVSPMMWILLATFPLGLAAVVYAKRGVRLENDGLSRKIAKAPLCLRVLGGVCCANMFVNCGLFMFVVRDGSPEVQSGRYVLMNHSRLIRPLTPEEYHLRRARIDRGFSGACMFIATGVMMVIAGAARMEHASRPAN